ncbi:MAG: hypothetical protein IT372_35570 [Polyangiaceae bacterium]|nr:hypothetical protein [Polyangiaceae bacterium]
MSITKSVVSLAVGHRRRGLEEWFDATWRRGLPDGKWVNGPVIGYRADGYLGQKLVILPSAKLVAVRMRREPEDAAELKGDTKRFPDFEKLVRGLAEPPGAGEAGI